MVVVSKVSDYNKVKQEAISFINTECDFTTKTKSRKIAKEEDRFVHALNSIIERLCRDKEIKELLQKKGLRCSFRGQHDMGHLTTIVLVLRRRELDSCSR